MDEADILGDRIAIMAKGQLQCCGSSLFLKKTYGVGYQLVIEKQSGQRAGDDTVSRNYDDTLKKIVTNNVDHATLLNNVGTEMSFQLPMASSGQFTPMFEGLDEQIEKGNVTSYGVSITTLEGSLSKNAGDICFCCCYHHKTHIGLPYFQNKEVFLLVARGHEAKKMELASSSIRVPGSEPLVTASEDAVKSSRSRMDLEKDGLFLRHMGALFKKRAAFFRRDKKAWCCTTILPGLFVLWGFLIFRLASTTGGMDELKLNFDKYNINVDGIRQPVVYNTPDEPFTCQPGQCVYQFPVYQNEATGETYGFCGSEGNLILDDLTTGELVLEDLVSGELDLEDLQSYLQSILLGNGDDVALNKSLCSIADSGAFAAQIEELDGFEAVGVTVSNVSEASVGIRQSKDNFAASQYGAIFFTHESDSTIIDSGTSYGDTVVNLCKSFSPSYTSDAACERLSGLGFLIQYNFTALHASPLFQALADQTIVNQFRAESGNAEDFVVDASIHPLPLTKLERGYSEAQDATSAWILVLLSFPFIAGAFASFVVAERESKAKHLQTVAGVEPTAYWVSTLLWDTANYLVPCGIVIALMYAFDVSVLITTTRNVASGVIATLLCFGPAAAGFSYVISFAFTSPSFCNVVIIVSGFLIGLGGPLTCFILIIIARDPGNPKPNLEDIADILAWVLRIFFPTFNLGRGLLNAINIEVLDFLYGESKTAWTSEVLLYDVIFLILQAIIYLILAIQLDVLSTNPSAMSIWKKFIDVVTFRACFGGRRGTIDITVALPEDDDVIAEQDRVAAGDANSDLIVLSQLTKIYDNGKVAVNNVSLGIPPGECFGLLGING
jgi:hypothetical protein